MSVTAESILKSITVGQPVQFHRRRLQSVCAAITQSVHINLILDQVGKDRRFLRVTRKILAFRTEEEEGFDDCGEVGAGEKLLHMLEKMGVENILLIICIWDDGMVGESGGEIYAALAERARDVLNIVREQVIGKTTSTAKTRVAVTLNPELPDPFQTVRPDRGQYRPAHFLSNYKPSERVLDSPESPVTEAEYFEALNKIENALLALNPADLQLLRRPPHHPLVTRVLQAVCILRGARVPTWGAIKEFLESRTLKIELIYLDAGKLRKSQVKMARDLLMKSPRVKLEALTQISVPAANLFSWIEGILTSYRGRHAFETTGTEVKAANNMIVIPSDEGVESKIEETVSDSGSEEVADQVIAQAPTITSQNIKKSFSPEIEAKLTQARKLEKDQEERIERLLSLRLEDINFSEKAPGLGDEVIREMSHTTISEQPTAVLLSLVSKLKEKRDAYMQ